MRKVIIGIFKGGQGKTTLAVSAAYGLARRGFRVVLVDVDPQTNATDICGLNSADGPNLYNLFTEDCPIGLTLRPIEENLAVIPGSAGLGDVDGWLYSKIARERILERRLAPLKADFVILDTSPAYSLVNVSAVVYASEAWSPISMDYLSLKGLKQFCKTLDDVETAMGHECPLRYLVPWFYDSRPNKTNAVMQALVKVHGEENITNPIRGSVRVSESASHRIPIFDYDSRNRVADDLNELIDRIANDSRGGVNTDE